MVVGKRKMSRGRGAAKEGAFLTRRLRVGVGRRKEQTHSQYCSIWELTSGKQLGKHDDIIAICHYPPVMNLPTTPYQGNNTNPIHQKPQVVPSLPSPTALLSHPEPPSLPHLVDAVPTLPASVCSSFPTPQLLAAPSLDSSSLRPHQGL